MPSEYAKPDILIPLGPRGDRGAHPGPDQKNVNYVSKEEFRAIFKRDYDDSVDKRAILIRNTKENGNNDGASYLSKKEMLNQAYLGPGVERTDAAKLAAYTAKMDQLRLDPDFSNIPKGPEIGVLVQKLNGSFEALDLERDGLRTLKDVQDAYGSGNVYMRDRTDSYLDVETSLETYKTAEHVSTLYAYHANIAPERISDDVAEVFVQVGSMDAKDRETFVPPALQRELAAGNPRRPQSEADISVLVATKNNGLQKPGSATFAKNLSEGGLKEILLRNGIQDPAEIKKSPQQPKPLLLVKIGNNLVSEAVARSKDPRPLDQQFDKKDIYVQNFGKNGKPTGNYTGLDTLERGADQAKLQILKEQLGISARQNVKSVFNEKDLTAHFANNLVITQQAQATQRAQNVQPLQQAAVIPDDITLNGVLARQLQSENIAAVPAAGAARPAFVEHEQDELTTVGTGMDQDDGSLSSNETDVPMGFDGRENQDRQPGRSGGL